MPSNIAIALVALVLFAGCAGTGYSAQDGAKKDACEKSGGYWQAQSGMCERPRS